MKVLTLHQPWASLVALGVKTIETRSWPTSYRGPLAIHAAKSVDYEGWKVGDWRWDRGRDGRSVLVRYCSGLSIDHDGEVLPLPLGAIVATCTLADVVPMFGLDNPLPERGGWLSVGSYAMWLRGYDTNRDVSDQRPYGDFTPGRYAWLLADVVPVDPPVPFKGGQGLSRTWEPEGLTPNL